MKKLSRQFSVLFALFCAFVLMFAQTLSASLTGSIAGSVKDPSGAMISSAKLTPVSIATHAKVKATSDSNGEFRFLQLTPAVCSLSVGSRRLQAGLCHILRDISVTVGGSGGDQ